MTLDSPLPFLGLDEEDPISLSYPWVLEDSDRYRMWYGSTINWDAGNGEMLHVIKYAESNDGHIWHKHKNATVPFRVGQFQAFSRPTVIKTESGKYLMWYSYRSGNGSNYQLGHASSIDCIHWEHSDSEIKVAEKQGEWDEHMIEYPYVFEHEQNLNMLYNGNGFGKSGFGLARILTKQLTEYGFPIS